ncbi:hypothetical protein, partial [Phyllobacterium salinisoli]|uniref:hypothetical protein n=1 Tax=Phyllobacterium salinisoli TaxID=1899321 RepID=UPI0011C023E9
MRQLLFYACDTLPKFSDRHGGARIEARDFGVNTRKASIELNTLASEALQLLPCLYQGLLPRFEF